jgi:hypothetical protein
MSPLSRHYTTCRKHPLKLIWLMWPSRSGITSSAGKTLLETNYFDSGFDFQYAVRNPWALQSRHWPLRKHRSSLLLFNCRLLRMCFPAASVVSLFFSAVVTYQRVCKCCSIFNFLHNNSSNVSTHEHTESVYDRRCVFSVRQGTNLATIDSCVK